MTTLSMFSKSGGGAVCRDSDSMLTNGISQPRQPQPSQRKSRSADRLRRMRSTKFLARERCTRAVTQFGQY
jgi:hypothetical protein